jgi:hypothetical protein
MGSATNELIIRVSLPALGFNTYFFEAKSNISLFLYSSGKVKASFLANEVSEVKVTQNDECIFQNQVRQ